MSESFCQKDMGLDPSTREGLGLPNFLVPKEVLI